MAEPLLTPETRDRVLRLAAEQIPLSAEVLYNAAAIRERIQSAGIRSEDHILNAFELVTLLQFDMACLVHDVFNYDGTPRVNLYARLLILTLREYSKAMRGILGRSFREQVTARLGPSVDPTLKDAHSQIQAAFDEIDSRFGDVRDGIVGHIDRDAETRATLLRRVNVEEVAQLALLLAPPVVSLSGCFTTYLAYLLGLRDQLDMTRD